MPPHGTPEAWQNRVSGVNGQDRLISMHLAKRDKKAQRLCRAAPRPFLTIPLSRQGLQGSFPEAWKASNCPSPRHHVSRQETEHHLLLSIGPDSPDKCGRLRSGTCRLICLSLKAGGLSSPCVTVACLRAAQMTIVSFTCNWPFQEFPAPAWTGVRRPQAKPVSCLKPHRDVEKGNFPRHRPGAHFCP